MLWMRGANGLLSLRKKVVGVSKMRCLTLGSTDVSCRIRDWTRGARLSTPCEQQAGIYMGRAGSRAAFLRFDSGWHQPVPWRSESQLSTKEPIAMARGRVRLLRRSAHAREGYTRAVRGLVVLSTQWPVADPLLAAEVLGLLLGGAIRVPIPRPLEQQLEPLP
eukprot:1782691-Prymnesium_polylepis.1